MITLTMQCSRCGKEVSHDMTNKTLSNDLVRKFGYSYAHNSKVNVLICNACGNLLKGLEDKLSERMKEELCSFFNDCEKGKENGNKGEPENG